MKSTHPVLGETVPLFREIANPFNAFDTGSMHGLAMVRGQRIDILAIGAHEPGRGDFSRFLAALKLAYTQIGIWEIHNPDLPAMLTAKGFTAATDVIAGDVVRGFVWTHQT